MPELPEIEIVKQSLDKKVKFEKIKNKVISIGLQLIYPTLYKCKYDKKYV